MESPRRLLSARILAVSVRPTATRSGAATSGASAHNFWKSADLNFSRALSGICYHVRDLGPWSKSEMSPKKSPGPSVVKIVSFCPIITRTRSSPCEDHVHAIADFTLGYQNLPLSNFLQMKVFAENFQLVVRHGGKNLNPPHHSGS